MESDKRPLTLYFCDECGSLRLRDVKDQLQLLFHESFSKPNICGICRKSISEKDASHQNESTLKSQCDEAENEFVTIKIQSLGSRSKTLVRSTNSTDNTQDNDDVIIKTERIDTPDADGDGKGNNGSKPATCRITRLSTGAIEVKGYTIPDKDKDEDEDEAESSGNSHSEDTASDDSDDSDHHMDVSSSTSKDSIPDQRKDGKQRQRCSSEMKPVYGTVGVDPELLVLMEPSGDPMLPFKCKFCDALPFKLLTSFQKHVRSHTGKSLIKEPYKCDVCAKRFKYRNELFEHQNEHSRWYCSVKDDSSHQHMDMKSATLKDFISDPPKVKKQTKKRLIADPDKVRKQTKKPKFDDRDKPRYGTAGVDPELLELMVLSDDPTLPFKCKFCDALPFQLLTSFQRHVGSHTGKSPSKLPYKCDVCAKRFQYRNVFFDHQSKHTRWYCSVNECELSFGSRNDLVNHLQVHNGELPFHCEFCALGFKDEATLSGHKTCHSNAQIFSCHHCDKTFFHVADFRRHLKRHNGDKHKCDKCSYTCRIKRSLENHQQLHDRKNEMKCERCHYVFQIESIFLRHCEKNDCKPLKFKPKETKKPPLPEEEQNDFIRWLDPRILDLVAKPISPSRPFKCKYCKDMEPMQALGAFLTHMKKFHPLEPVGTLSHFRCDLCDKTFDYYFKIRYHYRQYHTLVRPFKCDQCDKRYSTLGGKNEHQRHVHQKKQVGMTMTKTMTKHILCSSCGKLFPNNSQLNMHYRRVHLKLKPVVCDTCGKAYTCKAELLIHSIVHTKEKNFLCEFCDYRCGRKDYLIKHRRKHTGEKPYQCQHCAKAFIQRSLYKSHMKFHHPEETIEPRIIQTPRAPANNAETASALQTPDLERTHHAANIPETKSTHPTGTHHAAKNTETKSTRIPVVQGFDVDFNKSMPLPDAMCSALQSASDDISSGNSEVSIEFKHYTAL